MGPFVVVLLSLAIAGIVVAAAAALHRVAAREDWESDNVNLFSPEQERYMRQVRTRNWVPARFKVTHSDIITEGTSQV